MNVGYLKLTPSQLKEPVNVRIEEVEGVKTVVSDNDNYKPVVWLTRNAHPDAYQTGLTPIGEVDKGSLGDKMAIRITIKKRLEYLPWKLFADINKAERKYRKWIEAGRNPSEWYVSENPIPVTDFIVVENMVTGDVIYKAER